MIVVIHFLLLTTAVKNVHTAYSYALEDNLRTSLGIGTTYNLFVRPLSQVNVTVALNIITLNSLSISDQAMSLAGYLTMFWDDQRLDWSQDATYNTSIPAIYSNEENIWRPALIIENSVSDISIVSDANVLMKIQSGGSVIWTPSGIYITHCETDVTYYPFDTQSCDVIITTWGYTSIEIALYVAQEAVRLEYYKENGEWKYQGFSAYTTSNTREGSSTPEITFTLTFKRRPVFHVLNSLIPMVLLAFLSSMVFKLPPDSGERIGYSLTVLLAYAVYLTIISDNMPSSSSSTSVLTIYLLLVLALGVLSVIITIYVLDCHHKNEQLPVPKWLIKMSTSCLAKFACWKDNSCLCGRKVQPYGEAKDSVPETTDKHSGELGSLTWKDISQILDGFFLRLYLLIICFMTFILFLTLLVGYHIK
ncbi:acetylcholine receptor subunit alpha-1-A-like isoform X1 [Mytilus californianus]|uniref:acetylcholine receptor subunit alpha-1-A-like isoform X1 n=1 Tax=Mytilus californianus TaxID=6549 RepID=UPI00224556B0|nr:acetylcholine receptor subunit alpha-1-A-like isoform X1 [Mytilus californianus]